MKLSQKEKKKKSICFDAVSIDLFDDFFLLVYLFLFVRKYSTTELYLQQWILVPRYFCFYFIVYVEMHVYSGYVCPLIFQGTRF